MKLVFASAIALVLSGLASGCSSAPNDAVGTSGEDLSAAAAASPTAATSTVVRDPICPTGEKPCRVEEPDGKCGEVCVRDTALCVAPPKCEPSATSSAAAASDDRPTAATSTVVKDPICPTGEKPCRVEDPDGKCGEAVSATPRSASRPPSATPRRRRPPRQPSPLPPRRRRRSPWTQFARSARSVPRRGVRRQVRRGLCPRHRALRRASQVLALGEDGRCGSHRLPDRGDVDGREGPDLPGRRKTVPRGGVGRQVRRSVRPRHGALRRAPQVRAFGDGRLFVRRRQHDAVSQKVEVDHR